ncbi:right-handed parallel beta-helix repeat-containing protein [Paracoccus sphaerophysae]|uniref:Uncharacterized protein n=1 Tax=Paracoccus sphaerophysae TaxID=690417 RepID=A0A099EXT8_9RHOB|nr:right-handed parallel beta-helix repeat-containing protein [Paracoccus sphaerophysae]KGJ03255.1 hypothetical protein IC63_13570 [Paracoccus sphaerophysae]
MSGTATPNLPLSNGVDDVVGNSGGNTVRIALSRLAALLSYLQGPAYTTSAELFADKAWPDGAIGQVYGDTAGQNGTYRKSGAAGTGSWTRTGDLAVSPLTVAQLAGKADLTALNALITEVRSGRVFGHWSGNLLTLTPPEGTDWLLTPAGGSVQLWAPVTEGGTGEEYAQDATGQWWLRRFDARDLTAERAAREAADNAIRAAARDGLILPLVNVAGTGDAITADLSSTLIAAGITTLSSLAELDYVPIATNAAANPTITVAGMTLGIRDTGGGDWPAGGFRVGYIYKLRRRGMTARVSGGVSYREILDLGTRLSGQEARWTDRTVQIAAIDPAGYAVPGGTARIITEGGGWLSVWRVSDNQTEPESDTRKRTTDGKVWVRISRAPLEETVAPTMSAVSEVAAPALRRSTDAQSRVHELMDLGGGLHLPGLRGLSVQEHVQRLYARVAEAAQVLPYQTVINAVSDLGCDPNGNEPCQGIINAAINKLTATSSGPATIFYPRGYYRLTERILPKSNVSHIGAGRDQAIFLPTGIRAAFERKPSRGDYLENCIFSHFGVDGSNQVLNGGEYSVGSKALFIQGFRNCLFSDLHLYDTGATALGIDFADRSIIQRVLVERGGRLAAIGNPGASGIGIGTGWLLSEPLIIADCMTIDCRNYGTFVERQNAGADYFNAQHVIVHGLISKGNNHGFGEAGCDGTILTASQLTDNLSSGVVQHHGTFSSAPRPGPRFMLRGCDVSRNGGAGFEFDGTKNFGPRGYSSDGNRIEGNRGPGHWIRGGAGGTVDDFSFRGDDVIGNGGHCIHVESGTITNLDILDERLLRNTGSGVRLDAAIRGGRISGATIRDLQTTPTQTGSISGAGALTDFDIDGVQGVGCAPINLIGAQIRVTFGRNPGI